MIRLLLLLIGSLPLWAEPQYFSSAVLQDDPLEQIKLMTWNILGLPNDQVATRSWQARLPGIVASIVDANPDLVVLQEVFEPQLSESLFAALQDLYPYAYLDLSSSFTLYPSGLAIFSKLPLSAAEFSPHPDLLDGEQQFHMGILRFGLLDAQGKTLAVIATSHFQGSSRCQWRLGLTKQGQHLNYAEVRQQEAAAILHNIPTDVPYYIAGDLNVDRRSLEYATSLLNPVYNPQVQDALAPSQIVRATSTTYFKHLKGLAILYPDLTQTKLIELAQVLKNLAAEELLPRFSQAPWTNRLDTVNPQLFFSLEKELDLREPQRKMAFDYFVKVALYMISKENLLWKMNKNPDSPPVSIAEVIQVCALPFEEALDVIEAANPLAHVTGATILQGYNECDYQQTFSDHHPLMALIKIGNN